jgi:hypothetical protein
MEASERSNCFEIYFVELSGYNRVSSSTSLAVQILRTEGVLFLFGVFIVAVVF